MSTRTTFETSVGGTGKTQINSIHSAQLVFQEACNAVGVNVAANPQLGASDSQITAIKAANAAKLASLFAAEISKQLTLAQARDTLRTANDFGSF